MTTSRSGPVTSLGPLVPSVFVPALVFEIGIGAMLPMLAVTATRLGADLATAAVITALVAVGRIAADVPAGIIAARVGDRAAMVGASAVAVLGMSLLALAPNLPTMAVGVLLLGATDAVYALARQSFLTEAVAVTMRARALSTLGGVHRIGLFIGPFAGAGLIALTDAPGSAYWLGVVTSIAAAALVVIATDPDPPARGRPAPMSMRAVLRSHRRLLATLGIAVLLVGAMRGARMTVLPLWSEHLGVAPATTSLVFGIAGAVDMLLFYPAGKAMDRYGRLWIAVPSMLLMGAAMLLIPLTSTVISLTLVAMLLGFANGIGSGVIMTLGADVAPPGERAQFLGMWRLLADTGNATGPLVVSLGAALGSIAVGIATMGGLGAVTAAALLRWVPKGPRS